MAAWIQESAHIVWNSIWRKIEPMTMKANFIFFLMCRIWIYSQKLHNFIINYTSNLNEICLHCHWLYFSKIILRFGQCVSDNVCRTRRQVKKMTTAVAEKHSWIFALHNWKVKLKKDCDPIVRKHAVFVFHSLVIGTRKMLFLPCKNKKKKKSAPHITEMCFHRIVF